MKRQVFLFTILLCVLILLPSPVIGEGADSAPGGGSGTILFVTLPATLKDPHATTVPTTVSGARAAPATTTAAFGALQLNSVPSGASVYVDGALQGTTPVLLRTLSTGSHTITLKLNGYQDYTKTVAIPGGGFLEETWTLAPAAPAVHRGLLSVTSSPSGASVTIDGTGRGITPLSDLVLESGNHTILVQKAGFLDLSDTLLVPADQHVKKSYTLSLKHEQVPVSGISRIITSLTVTTIIPRAQQPEAVLPGYYPPSTGKGLENNSLVQMGLSDSFTVEPMVVTVRGRTYVPLLTTDSPYFRYQVHSKDPNYAKKISPDKVLLPITTILEVEKTNTTDHAFFIQPCCTDACTKDLMCPKWGDKKIYLIKPDAKFYNKSHFRWISDEEGVTALYQVSRFPFPAEGTLWNNQNIPGLIGSGPVKDVYVSPEGYHYFDINFAQVANHNPADPPFYTGFAYIENPSYGSGKPLSLMKIPLIPAAIAMKKTSLGFMSVSLPAGFAMIPDGEKVESELGDPNEGLSLLCTDCLLERPPSNLESKLMGKENTYYVRVVPIQSNGKAGVPSLPVQITVERPQPCPPQVPATSDTQVVVNPPSVKVASYYIQAYQPNDWIHTDQNGVLVAPAHYVSVDLPDCDYTMEAGLPPAVQWKDCVAYGLKANAQPNYHFIVNPPEAPNILYQIFDDLFTVFSDVIDAVSKAWADLQKMAVDIAAKVAEYSTFNLIECDAICKACLQTGLSVALSSMGIPPTIPNFAELESMGTGYLAKMAAEELGAGAAYEALPQDVKDDINKEALNIGNDMAKTVAGDTAATVSAAAGGSWYIPDALYYETHPAFVIIQAYNPPGNSNRTDMVEVVVKDKYNLYEPSVTTLLPPLAPGESVSLAVMLRERYTDVATPECPDTQYEGSRKSRSCLWNLWYGRVMDLSHSAKPGEGPDEFYTTMKISKDGYFIDDLKSGSDGKLLISTGKTTYDGEGNSCGITTNNVYLKFPQGWTLEQKSLSHNIMPGDKIWGNYAFSMGNEGFLIGST